jgi:hypothetical protein
MTMPLDPFRYTRSIRARRLRGCAALMEMIAMIGAENITDHDVSQVLTESELELREMLSFALTELSEQEGD